MGQLESYFGSLETAWQAGAAELKKRTSMTVLSRLSPPGVPNSIWKKSWRK